jgi:hypothetical protein
MSTYPQGGRVKYETKMAATRRGVVGAPSSGTELVLSKNYLPVAQIRVICKNGPQVSMDDIKFHMRQVTHCEKPANSPAH